MTLFELWRHCSLCHLTQARSTRSVVKWEPIASLDQLFSQAACLDVLLRKKVRELALISNGLFPIPQKDGDWKVLFCRYKDFVSIPGCGEIAWTAVKSPERALEKLLRSYGNDPSRLLDLCREGIVFNTVEDLVCCVRALLNDEEIRVVRIKNRLDMDVDSALAAGFRS
jgi:hypothetical protein